MARKQNVVQSSVVDVQSLVLGQLEDARKRLLTFEKELVKRGRAQQKELEALIRGVRKGVPVKQIEKKATAAKQSVLGALGVASRDEILQLNRELARLSKKVDALVTRKAVTPAA
ncbi:MAG: hypothetical protein ACO1OB_06305 [Archangium sp.]